MIINKIWSTEKRGQWNSFRHRGKCYDTRSREWEGWFLLGIIPLYVKNLNTFYSDRN